MTQIKHLLLDAANTVIHKPDVFTKILEVISNNGIQVGRDDLIRKHKMLSEVYEFPDQTSRAFYDKFNSELLLLLGVDNKQSVVDEIFEKCSYLPWKIFADVGELDGLQIPISILSNFNSTLVTKLKELLPFKVQNVIVSENVQLRKPDLRFYKHAIDTLKCEPDEILYIGDSFRLDFLPAKNVGMHTYLIDRDHFYGNQDFVIHSFDTIVTRLNTKS